MSALTALLEIQRLDNIVDQLRHRRENLPERSELDATRGEIARLDAAADRTRSQREDLRRRQRGLEDEADDIDEKAKQLEGRLYDGSITSPKEAAALGDEVAAMRARRSDLEDQAIELLEEIDPLDDQLARAEAARGELEARAGELSDRIAAAEEEIDGELEAIGSQRDEAASTIDDSTMEQYRKLRITFGHDAVVEFDAGRGGGCPVAMSAVELDRWKHLPAGSIEPCTDCGRLVVKLA